MRFHFAQRYRSNFLLIFMRREQSANGDKRFAAVDSQPYCPPPLRALPILPEWCFFSLLAKIKKKLCCSVRLALDQLRVLEKKLVRKAYASHQGLACAFFVENVIFASLKLLSWFSFVHLLKSVEVVFMVLFYSFVFYGEMRESSGSSKSKGRTMRAFFGMVFWKVR